MKELIKVQNKNGNTTVSGRELHEFLRIDTRFNDWIMTRIKEYEFLKGTDYNSFTEKSVKGGRPRVEYEITLDMAKELSMLENNEKGKEARKYFIGCEKELKSNQLQLNNDISKQIAEIVQAQLENQFSKQIEKVDLKYSENYRPTALNKYDISKYIKTRLGITKANDEYEMVKQRIFIVLGVKHWQDIPIEKFQNSISIIDECIDIIKKDRPYQQTSLL